MVIFSLVFDMALFFNSSNKILKVVSVFLINGGNFKEQSVFLPHCKQISSGQMSACPAEVQPPKIQFSYNHFPPSVGR